MSSVSIIRGREAGNLIKALDALKERRDAELARVHKKYQPDIAALEQALSVLTGEPAPSDEETPDAPGPHRQRPHGWVSDEKLDAVRRYLQANGTARQADIAKDLELNTGSVSVALSVLSGTDDLRSPQVEVRELGTNKGSREWEYIGGSRAKRSDRSLNAVA